MEICALSSGSDGNSFLIEGEKNSILIDAGISCKKIEDSISLVGKDIKKLSGIFLSHEHLDHVRGIDVLARKYKIPIYTTKKVEENSFICSDKNLINHIKRDDNIIIDDMEIISFSKNHKSIEPMSFSILNRKTNKVASVITDVGSVCKNVSDAVSSSNVLFFESNYDEKMINDGPYPIFLKKWVDGETGHLSNTQSSICVLESAKSKIENLVLSHISKHNNTHEMALSKHNEIIRHRMDLSPKISISSNIPTKLFKF